MIKMINEFQQIHKDITNLIKQAQYLYIDICHVHTVHNTNLYNERVSRIQLNLVVNNSIFSHPMNPRFY